MNYKDLQMLLKLTTTDKNRDEAVTYFDSKSLDYLKKVAMEAASYIGKIKATGKEDAEVLAGVGFILTIINTMKEKGGRNG